MFMIMMMIMTIDDDEVIYSDFILERIVFVYNVSIGTYMLLCIIIR